MNYEEIAIAMSVCLLAATATGAPQHRDWDTESREAIHHVFGGDKTLDVDNINGYVSVIGDGGTSIRVEGEKIVRGADQREIDRAKREVALDINEKDGVAQLYVNGPFRDNGHSSQDHGFHEHGGREYEVTYNFTIHVPRDTDLQLRSVNGELKAEQTSGKFDLRSVNGAVTMTSAAGSGKADTVNGPLVISFRENPRAASSFRTVNGRIEATFQPSLSADLGLKTVRGAIYTDFDTTALAALPGTMERKNGRFVHKADRQSRVRIGSGGPELSFETVNGAIRIQKGK